VRNDSFNDDMRDAFDQIEVQTDKLEVTAWIMRCMADPMEKPPRASMGQNDLMHFFADLLIEKVANLDQLAATARIRVLEREKASR
jgi:hypothetical protein